MKIEREIGKNAEIDNETFVISPTANVDSEQKNEKPSIFANVTKMMSSVKKSLENFFFETSTGIKNKSGKMIPAKSHHFEPMTKISSWIPTNNGMFCGVKKIKRHRQTAKFAQEIINGINLFFFIKLR